MRVEMTMILQKKVILSRIMILEKDNQSRNKSLIKEPLSE